MSFIWATRGRAWGFRFLLTGGFSDPLPEYEAAFADAGDAPETCHRAGDRVALRIADPLGRKDQSGRVIPHEFVVCGPQAAEIHSVADGLALVWPQVAEEFERVWETPRPPF
ncbi:hypothetical protein [Micromonospora zamorensis]|uniref:hypothetical protein n=1 Tax=Micromonospora zamorensis TaxID=709883 RepID=UPI00081FB051|nr:hypothetical protein [Micromonospora zamorensis]SCG45753.1 hypothetical protein GA0070619_1733 [Micromonospora zamorensis]